jgi:hypothetical protein
VKGKASLSMITIASLVSALMVSGSERRGDVEANGNGLRGCVGVSRSMSRARPRCR